MANRLNGLIEQIDIFLNHLCDGERPANPQGQDNLFLNHLCDGERPGVLTSFITCFLNHLCDGELEYGNDT